MSDNLVTTVENNDFSQIRTGVSVFICTEEGNFLLGKRLGTPLMPETFALPGGHVDFGETWRQAAVREVYEETRLRISEDDLQFVGLAENSYPEIGRQYITLFAYVKIDEGSIIITAEPHKCEGWFWSNWNLLDTHPLFPALESFKNSEFAESFLTFLKEQDVKSPRSIHDWIPVFEKDLNINALDARDLVMFAIDRGDAQVENNFKISFNNYNAFIEEYLNATDETVGDNNSDEWN